MRIRKTSLLIFAFLIAFMGYSLWALTKAKEEADEGLKEIHPIEEEISLLNEKVRKLEDEARGNVQILGSIKKKLDVLIEVENVNNGQPIAGAQAQIEIPKNPVQFHGQCPATVPYRGSGSSHHVDKFYEEWDFVDRDGGVWKQGWDIASDDAEWKDTKLQIILMPHSHNDPGWIKTLDGYYTGQTRTILKVITDALSKNKGRKFIWAETIFLNKWFDDPEVADDYKNRFKQLVKNDQIEIVTGGWVMTEEAPTHYFAMADQLIEGHQWLKKHFDYHPKNGYNCDTFGASPTTAYLNHLAGIDHMLIQRTHYVVKKHFAEDNILEFNWRQSFDNTGEDETFTHMMPFYSYDVPHTCGPDPKVCCQFDFRRLASVSPRVSCPWRVDPVEINAMNVGERARKLLDQYRKKSKLFAKGTESNTRVVLTLLGDDFRYDSDREAAAQFENYEKLFEYINNTPQLNAEASFGTLRDYFALVDKARPISKSPSVTGDFFSYADRTTNYWTGFFNSRPFLKWFDRRIEHWLQAADTMLSIGILSGKIGESAAEEIYKKIRSGTRELDLFQHHDAITGTEKDFVHRDYADHLLEGYRNIKDGFGETLKALVPEEDVIVYPLEEELKERGRLPKAKLVTLGDGSCVNIDVYNSLLHETEDLVRIKIDSHTLTATYMDGTSPTAQVNPWWDIVDKDQLSGRIIDANAFELIIVVNVKGLSTRRVKLCNSVIITPQLVPLSEVGLGGGAGASNLDTFTTSQLSEDDITLSATSFSAVLNPKNGLLKQIVTADGQHHKAELQFAKYGCRGKGNSQDNSGSYLFAPDGPSTVHFGQNSAGPFRVISGPALTEVQVGAERVLHRLAIVKCGISSGAILVDTFVDVRGGNNLELVLQVKTDVDNHKTLFTDLNGLTITKKVYYDKLTIQGNVYPVVSAAYIQDIKSRFTILPQQSSGVTSQRDGEIEIWLDRTLAQDDSRGMGQPVTDNAITMGSFKFIVESTSPSTSPDSIYLSTYANRLSEYTHSPLLPSLLRGSITEDSSFSGLSTNNIPHDAKLVNLRPTKVNGSPQTSVALILRRYGSDCSLSQSMSFSDDSWPINLSAFSTKSASETSLTLLDTKHESITSADVEPMKIKVYHFK